MKKRQLIELIRGEALKNGEMVSDDIGKLHPKRIEKALAQTYADLVFLTLKGSPHDLDAFTKNYNNVDVEYNREEKSYQSTLPAEVIQLPMNGGVRLIKPHNTNRKFYPSINEDIDIYTDTDIAKYYDRNLFILDGNKVKYINFDWASHNVRKVNMKLVVSLEEYGWDEDIKLPAGRETEFTNLVAQRLYNPKRFLDTTSDNA